MDGRVQADGARKPCFAVFLTWPDLKNAEYEVVHRIAAAGKNLGAEVTVVDNDGYPLWSTEREIGPDPQRISHLDHDFAISLHFESPRLIDLYTYTALWNPPEFYKVFGYDASLRKLVTHNDVLSCDSEMADRHATVAFEGYGRKLQHPLPRLFHSLPGPFLEPSIDAEARLFYIGMNWERLGGQKGRHHDLLEELDAADLISIYGPELFLGVKPWDGFRTYVGEIPFDGRSILSEINKAGVCLAFSSAAHQRSGIMSNRLFEGLAAGAAIIANPHPIIDKYFRDCVYVVDDNKPPKDLSREILNILRGIRSDPSEALAKARRGQDLMKARFSLEEGLGAIIRAHPDRSAVRESAGPARPVVAVIAIHTDTDGRELSAMLDDIVGQRGVDIHLTLICDAGVHDANRAMIAARVRTAAAFKVITGDFCAGGGNPVGGGNPASDTRLTTQGPLVAEALADVTAPAVCLMNPGEHWFSDHLASLVATLDADEAAMVAASGLIVEKKTKGALRRQIDDLVYQAVPQSLWATGPTESGRFLFRTALLRQMPERLLAGLDGLEHRALLLWACLSGSIAQSSYATLVRAALPLTRSRLSPLIEEDLQVDFIRDSVRANPEWLRLSSVSPLPPPVPVISKLVPGKTYALKAGEAGTEFLAGGFSTPEKDRTWIDGQSGSLRFRLEKIERGANVMLRLGSRRALSRNDQRCTVFVNGSVVIDDKVLSEDEQRLRVPLDAELLEEDDNEITVEMKASHAEQVRDGRGRLVDGRHLGIWLSEIELDAAGSGVPLAIGTPLRLGAGDEGISALTSGFSRPEAEFTWIDGDRGTMQLTLPADIEPDDATLVIEAAGRKSSSGRDQECTVLIEGESVVENVVVPESMTRIKVPLRGLKMKPHGETIEVELSLSHAEPVMAEDGSPLDPRELGLRVASVELVFGAAETEDSPPEEATLQPQPPLATTGRSSAIPDAPSTWKRLARRAAQGLRRE